MHLTSHFKLMLALVAVGSAHAETVISPDGQSSADITLSGGRLSYSVANQGVTCVETSPLGFTMNGADRGTNITLGAGVSASDDQSFQSRHGVHTTARDHYNSKKFTITHTPTGQNYILHVRAYDSGVAFRYELSYVGAKNITAETTSFILPARTRVSYQGGIEVYENVHTSADISAIASGTLLGPPTVGKLPGNSGYVAITHSAPGDGFPNPYLVKAAGGTGRQLQNGYIKNGDNTYGASSGATVFGPWNVVTMGSLDTLVNSDMVEALAPAPDPALFPEGTATTWATPGRSVWNWMSRFPGGLTAENSKLESLWASQLGFEYNTVDDGWANWNGGNPWAQITDVAAYSRAHGVKVLVWVYSRDIQTRAQRAEYFSKLRDAGVSGIKADFFDFSSVSPASKERMRLIERILKDAAAYNLMVNLHGTGKPLGQFRTYPNLLNIEGVYGKESFPEASTTAYVPLTRLLAGPSDYTPLGMQGKLQGGQTQAFEIASVIGMAGPLVSFAERGDRIAQSPFAGTIKSIPGLWDETKVLSGSELGESSAMARRKGTSWFIGIMNANTTRTWPLDLSFLTPGVTYQAEIIRDGATTVEYRTVTSATVLSANTAASGGFVAKLTTSSIPSISAIPFDTNFGTASGTAYAEDGQLFSPWSWGTPLLAGKLPDLMWSMTGNGLTPSLDKGDAWLGGSSIKVSGTLQATSDLSLFGADVVLASATKLFLSYKKAGAAGAPGFKVGLTFGDAPASPVLLDVNPAVGSSWQSVQIPLQAYEGRTLKAVFLRFSSVSSVAGYSVNIGRLALGDGSVTPPAAPANLQMDQVVTHSIDDLTVYLKWQAPAGPVAYYRIYQKESPAVARRFLGATAATTFSSSTSRIGNETQAVFEVAAISASGGVSALATTSVSLPPRPLLTNPLSGTIIGTTGSFENSTNTRDKVFDGQVSTFFDAAQSDNVWAGIDLGASGASKVVGVQYYPRDGWAGRMNGGVFQGSNNSDFSSAVTLATVSATPAEGQYTLVAVSNASSFRYLRYLSPNGGWGNVAEVKFYGPGTLPAPSSPEAGRSATSALLKWAPVASAQNYRVKRSTVAGGPYSVIAGSVTSTSYSDTTVQSSSRYFYVVSAVSAESTESPDSVEVEAIDAYLAWAAASGLSAGDPALGFLADLDGDGISNGVEYMVPAGVQISVTPSTGAEVFAEVRADNFVSLDLFSSSDLIQWAEVAGMSKVPSPTTPGFLHVSYQSGTITGTLPRFYRFAATR